MKKYDPNAKVELTCDSPISNKACLSIGDLMIPFTEATITLRTGDFVQLTVTTRIDLVDVKVLQEHTNIVVEPKEEQ